MNEFEEIYLTGGKIEFKKDPKGGVSIGYSCSNKWAMCMFQVCVSFEGKVLDIVAFEGIGKVVPYPQPSLLAWVLSDRHGMFGCRCPKCLSYFRVSTSRGDQFCPYCGKTDKRINFLTDNQLKYIGVFCNSFIEAHECNSDIILDLDSLSTELPENKPQWLYSEEKQQNSYSCDHCKTNYDILGEYGLCPNCGNPNVEKVFLSKMEDFEKQFHDLDKNITDRHEREVEWEKLTRCVSEFESLANKLRDYMIRFPATKKRRNALKAMTFQNILKAHNSIREWYDFEILDGLSEVDHNFLNTMFNRRHLFTHNAGCVDQEYIDNTKDKTVRLNQTLRVKSKEIIRLINLVKCCGLNLIKGYTSIEVED